MFISKQELELIQVQIKGLQASNHEAHTALIILVDKLVEEKVKASRKEYTTATTGYLDDRITQAVHVAGADIVRSLDTLVDEAVKRECAGTEERLAESFATSHRVLLAAIREDKAEPVTQRCGYQKLPFAARCELSNGHPGKHFVTKGQNAKPRK